MNIQPLLARRVQGMKPSPIRKLVPEQVEEGMIRFAKMIYRERDRIGKLTGF